MQTSNKLRLCLQHSSDTPTLVALAEVADAPNTAAELNAVSMGPPRATRSGTSRPSPEMGNRDDALTATHVVSFSRLPRSPR